MKVTIADREYDLAPLPIRKAKAQRLELEKILQSVGAEFQGLSRPTEASGAVIDIAQDLLVKSPDICFDFLCGYSPAIQADREYLEDHGFDEQIIHAFWEVLNLLYPFGPLVKSLLGLEGLMTSKNSSSPSTASAAKS